MSRMHFEAHFRCTPEQAWPWLTVPGRMNQWSEASVAQVPADGIHPDEVGTLREVRVPLFGPFRMTLLERVVVSRRPTELQYEVIGGGMLRHHRGTLELSSDGRGATTLRWTVRFTPHVPGTGWIARAFVEPPMRRSLRALERRCAASAA